MRKTIIGVMGPGDRATQRDVSNAFELGRLIAQEGWILLTGGRDSGVMESASKGAKDANGLTVGILPTSDQSCASQYVDIPIVTGLDSARNNLNVLSSAVVIACGMGTGTASEVCLALKARKPVILLTDSQRAINFFSDLGGKLVHQASSPSEAIATCRQLLKCKS